jgi:hypothetical protein
VVVAPQLGMDQRAHRAGLGQMSWDKSRE